LRLGAIGSQALPTVLKLVLQQCPAERKRTNVVKRRFPVRLHAIGGIDAGISTPTDSL
jgi:hypothetical protein